VFSQIFDRLFYNGRRRRGLVGGAATARFFGERPVRLLRRLTLPHLPDGRNEQEGPRWTWRGPPRRQVRSHPRGPSPAADRVRALPSPRTDRVRPVPGA